MTGQVLSPDLDGVLQDIVAAVARVMATPVALVSVALERTLMFRAFVGLSGDLAVARGTDREVSLCQFVVRDGRGLMVTDATAEDQFPTEMVDSHGLRAYVGEPISVSGTVIGALCAIDRVPRAFSVQQRARLVELAARASERMQELAEATRATHSALIRRTAGPAFAELRNILGPLYGYVTLARAAVADLGPMARLARELSDDLPAPFASLTTSTAAFVDLAAYLDAIEDSGLRMAPLISSLEQLVLPSRGVAMLNDVVDAADQLALQHTRPIGGVAWQPCPAGVGIAAPRIAAIAMLAAALSRMAMAEATPAAVDGAVDLEGTHAVVRLRRPDVETAVLTEIARELNAVVGGDQQISAAVTDDWLTLRYLLAA